MVSVWHQWLFPFIWHLKFEHFKFKNLINDGVWRRALQPLNVFGFWTKQIFLWALVNWDLSFVTITWHFIDYDSSINPENHQQMTWSWKLFLVAAHHKRMHPIRSINNSYSCYQSIVLWIKYQKTATAQGIVLKWFVLSYGQSKPPHLFS